MSKVSVREISKTFPGVLAVDRVSIDFRPGEIHAILGENGAGKSTLMHLLSGLYKPDAGEIWIDGQQQIFSSPRAALAAGIAMVHQHFMLVPTLSLAENIFLALPGHSWNLVRRHDLARQVEELAIRYGVTIDDPHVQVGTLSVGAQQRIEILKALAGNTQVLILDEPTAVLTPAEVENLFHSLRRLTHDGYLVLLITHKIPEVLAVSDRLSVLRRGQLVTTRETASCTADELATLMVGEASHSHAPHPATTASTHETARQVNSSLLTLENVWVLNEHGGTALREISFTLHAGEVVGIAGVDGNGQTELAEILTGLRPLTRGTLSLQNQPVKKPTPASLRSAGISLIPQDRRKEGLALSLPIQENLLLNTSVLTTLVPGPLLPFATVRHFAEKQIARFDIRSPSPTQPVSALSGGNQQRVVIARELSPNPQIIVAANPSRGLDVNATRYVHDILRDCCRRGAGVILISTDLDEILTLSTRIYTLYRGQLLGPVEATTSREQLGQMMTGTWAQSESPR
jgi:simple sugar transport system ATP-binding protein